MISYHRSASRPARSPPLCNVRLALLSPLQFLSHRYSPSSAPIACSRSHTRPTTLLSNCKLSFTRRIRRPAKVQKWKCVRPDRPPLQDITNDNSGVEGKSPWTRGSGGEAPWSWKHFDHWMSNGAGKFSRFPKMSSTAGNESSNCWFVGIA